MPGKVQQSRNPTVLIWSIPTLLIYIVSNILPILVAIPQY